MPTHDRAVKRAVMENKTIARKVNASVIRTGGFLSDQKCLQDFSRLKSQTSTTLEAEAFTLNF